MPGNSRHLIGLCGFAGAGKDTIADLLVAHAGFRKLAFADPLKAELEFAFHVEPIIFTRPEFKERPMAELALSRCTEVAFINAALRALFEASGSVGVTSSEELAKPRSPRQIMQWWGTEYRRAADPQYWAKQTAARIDAYWRETPRLVLTDVRFPNEAEVVRRRGGVLWQVKRPDRAAGSTHASATDGAEFAPDAIFRNEHDIRHLQQLVLGEFWAMDAGLEGVEVKIR